MSTTKRVTTNLRAEMVRQGLNQSDLAARLGPPYTQQTVSRRLSGVGLTVDDLEAMCDALGIDLATAYAEHKVSA